MNNPGWVEEAVKYNEYVNKLKAFAEYCSGDLNTKKELQGMDLQEFIKFIETKAKEALKE